MCFNPVVKFWISKQMWYISQCHWMCEIYESVAIVRLEPPYVLGMSVTMHSHSPVMVIFDQSLCGIIRWLREPIRSKSEDIIEWLSTLISSRVSLLTVQFMFKYKVWCVSFHSCIPCRGVFNWLYSLPKFWHCARWRQSHLNCCHPLGSTKSALENPGAKRGVILVTFRLVNSKYITKCTSKHLKIHSKNFVFNLSTNKIIKIICWKINSVVLHYVACKPF